ncbi:MAG: cupin domain-containing protein [Thermoleophilia bacterium]|jgi:quercetin dioxygenase-like cupin family protein
MASKFITQHDVPVTDFDWGSAGMRCSKHNTGCESFVVLDVTLEPGFCHDFHKHVDQDEMIIVKAGQVTQYIDGEASILNPGDSVYLDRDVVHGSFNDGTETALLQVVLAPAMGDGGYELVDMSGEAPWSGLRG